MANTPTGMEDIQRLYTDYLEQVRQAELSRRPFDGYMGFGPKLGDSPIHGQFAQNLEALLRDIDQREPNSGQVREMLEYIYRAPQEHRKPPAVYWMLIAVHGLTIKLTDRLEKDDAVALWTEYKRLYRPGERLPAQKKTLAALKRAQT